MSLIFGFRIKSHSHSIFGREVICNIFSAVKSLDVLLNISQILCSVKSIQ